MLLTYISICVSDSALLRTADVIQMNMQMEGLGHGAKEAFKMSNAYTYISITASAKLDMFFMDLGMFADLLAEEEDSLLQEDTQTADGEDGGLTLIYKGLLGY